MASGQVQGPQDPPICDSKHNNLRGKATQIDINRDDIHVKKSDPDQDNFDEKFTYYRVDHDQGPFSQLVYREPARLGPENHCLGSGSYDSFWFGVSAPGDDGIQHEITHEGKVSLYFQETDGDWKSLIAQFDGKGNLLRVNGVKV